MKSHANTYWAKFTLLSTMLFSTQLSAQTPVNRIVSDYGGIWNSASSALNPDSSHHLLAFQVDGSSTVYSTGVNDALLTTNNIAFTPAIFEAFSTSGTFALQSSTVLGVGFQYGGAGNVNPVPVTSDIAFCLSDGINGLDLGTGVFNIPPSTVRYNVTAINASTINDGIPDLFITQIGQTPNTSDSFRFIDASGQTVGNSIAVAVSTLPPLGQGNWKFYNLPSLAYNNGLAGTRFYRATTFDLDNFGINATNSAQVVGFEHKLSGESDQAFTAYNVTSFTADPGVILPIKLHSFRANSVGNTTLLSWAVSDAKNFDHFEIERSADGLQFHKLDMVSFKPGEELIQRYSVTDHQPLNGMNFYRLKMVDVDDKYSYSPIELVRFSHSWQATLSPNPFLDRLEINIKGQQNGALTAVIVDLLGKVVYSNELYFPHNVIDLRHLPAGNYILRISDAANVMEQKITKSN
jgi:hypothetical protein